MKKILLILYIVIKSLHCNAQRISTRALTTSGGSFTVGNRTLSWTVGETFCKTLTNGNHVMSLGVLQPFIVVKVLNVKTYLEGFYTGSGFMQAVLYNNSLSLDSTACDSIVVELHKTTAPYDLVATTKGLLHTNGSAVIKFPSSLKFNSYYLVIRHRNSVETWSKTPVILNKAMQSYDFAGQ